MLGYDLVNFRLNLHPGANLDKVFQVTHLYYLVSQLDEQ